MEAREIHLTPLFAELSLLLHELLTGLNNDEWYADTVCKAWQVKDIAAHLLDGNLRRIGLHRDGYSPKPTAAINGYNDLLAYLNGLNADWVKACQRLSPGILTEWLAATNAQVNAIFEGLNPYDNAVYGVSWAGQQQSPNWFDTAREYTERFLHQQQIRHAVNKAGLLTERLYYPFLNTLMQALPYTYRNTKAPPGTTLQVTVTGPGGGHWYITCHNGQWAFAPETATANQVVVDGAIAWRLFSKGISQQEALPFVAFHGNETLGKPILAMAGFMV